MAKGGDASAGDEVRVSGFPTDRETMCNGANHGQYVAWNHGLF